MLFKQRNVDEGWNDYSHKWKCKTLVLLHTVPSTSANSTELFLSWAHPGNCCLHVYVFTVEETFLSFFLSSLAKLAQAF